MRQAFSVVVTFFLLTAHGNAGSQFRILPDGPFAVLKRRPDVADHKALFCFQQLIVGLSIDQPSGFIQGDSSHDFILPNVFFTTHKGCLYSESN
jgi:hypothetical protein